jgi:hypothetical protein
LAASHALRKLLATKWADGANVKCQLKGDARPLKDEMLNRVREHFGYVDETALIVLKGHLLVEESLDSIISKFVFHPEFLEMANLGFAQKVSIARALNLTEHENEIWEIATKLNSLRNEIAHGLNSPKRAKKTACRR